MATPSGFRSQPKAPELGSFPLDHYRECRNEIEDYYRCLQVNQHMAPKCRDQTRTYLECRMEKGLMNKADVASFGIPDTEFVPTVMHKKDMRAHLQGSKMEYLGPNLNKVLKEHSTKEDGFEREREQPTK